MGNFLVVQWLGLHVFTTEGLGSIPGRGTKIPQATQPEKKRHGIHETGESMGKERKRNISKGSCVTTQREIIQILLQKQKAFWETDLKGKKKMFN